MNEHLPRILVIDSERHMLDSVCRGLLLHGYRCRGVQSPKEALDALASDDGDGLGLVLIDLTGSGRSGLELIERVRVDRPQLPIVAITGLASTKEVEVVREMGVPLLQKPFDPDTLDTAIRRALGRER